LCQCLLFTIAIYGRQLSRLSDCAASFDSAGQRHCSFFNQRGIPN
jgi:hypothetical protein